MLKHCQRAKIDDFSITRNRPRPDCKTKLLRQRCERERGELILAADSATYRNRHSATINEWLGRWAAMVVRVLGSRRPQAAFVAQRLVGSWVDAVDRKLSISELKAGESSNG